MSFFDSWTCHDCGVDYGLRLRICEPIEVQSVFAFLRDVQVHAADLVPPATLVLAKSLEDPADPAFISFVDTLLLFFDSVIVPGLDAEDLARALGDAKCATYRRHGLVRTADTSYVVATAAGTVTPPSAAQKTREGLGYDLDLLDPRLEGRLLPPTASVRLSLLRCIENLERLYFEQLLGLLRATNLFNQHRVGDTSFVVLRGQTYRDDELAHLVPGRYLRQEVFSYIYGVDLLVDQHYAIAPALRECLYAEVRRSADWEWRAFSEWLRTTEMSIRPLEPDAVLKFRQDFGSLSPLISDLKGAIAGGRATDCRGAIREVADALEARLRHCRRVFSKGHEVRAMYLSGLMGTLGGLLGGPVGAVVAGIGAVAASQLALEYDRRVPGPLIWLSKELRDGDGPRRG